MRLAWAFPDSRSSHSCGKDPRCQVRGRCVDLGMAVFKSFQCVCEEAWSIFRPILSLSSFSVVLVLSRDGKATEAELLQRDNRAIPDDYLLKCVDSPVTVSHSFLIL